VADYWIFIWDGENDTHVEEHGVTREEAEDVVCNPAENVISVSSGRPAVYGYTASGRRLFVAYEIVDDVYIYVITAYEPERQDNEKRS